MILYNYIFHQGFPLKSKPVRLNVLVPPSSPVISVGSYYGQVLDGVDGEMNDWNKRCREWEQLLQKLPGLFYQIVISKNTFIVNSHSPLFSSNLKRKQTNKPQTIFLALIYWESRNYETVITKITTQGNELLVEEGVRVEIMCQAKGRPQPEVTLMALAIFHDSFAFCAKSKKWLWWWGFPWKRFPSTF